MLRQAEGVSRILGTFGPRDRGPTLVVVSGLHGNEPAGVLASQRVAKSLQEDDPGLRGRLILLAGNVPALRQGVRYLDRDLNRAWTADQIRHLRNGGGGRGVEDREQQELLTILDTAMQEAPEELFLLDLHTTSGAGSAFSTVADTLRNRELALRLPVPMVLGLEELVEGTLHDYTGKLGVVTVAFESGQHQEAEAVDRAEAALWLMMAATGLLAPERHGPKLSEAYGTLARDHGHLPRALEMRYRHPVAPEDRFAMKAGYRNFQPVRKGEAVATDLDGPVLVPENARILMPLYQQQGTDGFFIVREFRPFWLRVSKWLRRIHVDRYVHWLPGIRRHPQDSQSLVVNRHVARWFALQLLHLLGFRRVVDVGDVLVVQRRARDG